MDYENEFFKINFLKELKTPMKPKTVQIMHIDIPIDKVILIFRWKSKGSDANEDLATGTLSLIGLGGGFIPKAP